MYTYWHPIALRNSGTKAAAVLADAHTTVITWECIAGQRPQKSVAPERPPTVALPAYWRLMLDESGQNLVEYGLVVGLLALAALVSFTGMSDQLKGVFSSLGSALGRYVIH